MKREKAASAATAKRCLDFPLTVSVPAALIDDTIITLKNVHRVIRDELDVRLDSLSCNGRLMGPDDEHHVYGLNAVAEVAAASKGVRGLVGEMKAIKKAAKATPACHPLQEGVDALDAPDKSIRRRMPDQDDIVAMIVGADAAALRIRARDAESLGEHSKATILLGQAAMLDGDWGDLITPAAGTDPEGEASARLAKSDARGHRIGTF